MAEALPVLVVEDNSLLLLELEDELAAGGYRAVTASDGAAALTLFEQEPGRYRALITDAWLKRDGLTGWDVARRARELRPNLPVIYVTGAPQVEWSALGVPGSMVLEKPFAGAQLLTAVSQLINATATSRDGPAS